MTSWWNKNINNRLNDFKAWVGTAEQPSKKYCRNYIIFQGYRNIIDCGCGLSTDYEYFKDNNVKYTGLDSCQYFVETNKSNGIEMIEAELEGDLPLLDNSYDCVYCREVLEHLSYYEKALSEMIRISSQEVILVFFIKPDDEEDKVNYWEEEDLYHNKYNKEKLETFLTNNPKVRNFFWRDIADEPYHVEPLPVPEPEIIAENIVEENIVAENTVSSDEPITETEIVENAVEQVTTDEPVEILTNAPDVDLIQPIEEPEKPTGEKIVLHIILRKS